MDLPSDSLGTPPMHVPNYLYLEVAGADALIFALCPVKAWWPLTGRRERYPVI